MGRQALKQQARRAAMEVQAERRRAAAERERRLSERASRVVVAIFERAEVVTRTEREAGEVLHAMTAEDGLSLREAVELCGGKVSEREAGRLRQAYRRTLASVGAGTGTDGAVVQVSEVDAGQDGEQDDAGVSGRRDASPVGTPVA